MNCDRCPHMKRIIAALRPCQACEAGKLHGQISTDASPVADRALRYRLERSTASSGYVTRLSPESEDAMRTLLAELTQLEPIELLLVRHVLLGGKYHTFGASLMEILRRLRTKERELEGKKGGFRSLVNVWADKIRDRLPVFRSVLYRAEGGES